MNFRERIAAANTILFTQWYARTRQAMITWTLVVIRVRILSYGLHASQLPRDSTMAAKSQRQEERENAVSSLNAAIEAVNHAENISNIPPVKAAFGSASILLSMIRVSFLLVYDSRRWLMYTELDDQQSGLRQTGADLRRRLRSP